MAYIVLVKVNLGMSIDKIAVRGQQCQPTNAVLEAGIVDISELPTDELGAFVESTATEAADIGIQRRGGRTFLITK